MGGARDEQTAAAIALLAGGRPVGVVGEPGIGITTMLAHAAAQLPGPVVRTGCLRTLRTVLYLPLSRVLEADVARRPKEVVRRVQDLVGPGTLVIDDLQWADGATLGLLADLAPAVRLLVGIRLGDECSPSARSALAAVGGTQLRVAPLGVATCRTIACTQRPDLDDATIDRLVTEAGGNPLALHQLLATGVVARSLAEALSGALATLGQPARCLLGALSERGRGMPADDLSPEQAELVDAGLVEVHGGVVRVRHRLVADAALKSLDSGSRTSVHRLLATLAESSGERAHHLVEAGDHTVALPWARAAAADAPVAERHHFLALAARCVTGPERTLTLVEGIDAALAAWDRPAARALAEDLHLDIGAGGDPVALASIAEARARDGAPEEAHEAAARVSGASDAEQARARAADAIAWAWPQWEPEKAQADAATAGALATTVLTGQAVALSSLVAGAPTWADHLARLPPELVALAAMWGGHGDEALAAIPALGPAVDVEVLGAIVSFHLSADCDRLAVRLGQALEVIERPVDREVVTAHLAVALADSGRTGVAAEVTIAALRASPSAVGEGHLLWALVEAELAGGRLVRARKAAQQAQVAAPSPARCLASLAGTWATALSPDGREPESPMGDPAWPGLRAAALEQAAVVLRAAGSVEAVTAFDEAADAWASWHRRGELRCRWAAGDALRATDVEGAVARLQELEEHAGGLGQRPLVARVRASLRAAGVRTRPSRGTGRGPLSARECEVLELVRLGFTTVEAAISLGVASSTVETQVESAMRKLGARTRLQAAARLAELVP